MKAAEAVHTQVLARSTPVSQGSPGWVPRLRTKARRAQALEPILFPKLRIYFADFPYLHCSIN